MAGIMQKAKSTARQIGTRVWVYANPDLRDRHSVVISNVEPPPQVWPCEVVEPDGSYQRRVI